MSNFESAFTSRGFAALQRVTLDAVPANPRERAESIARKISATPEQVIKAVALQVASVAAGGEAGPAVNPGAPLILLLLTPERLDLKVVSKLLGQNVDYYPQDKIERDFGASMNALSPLAAPERNIRVIADGRVFEQNAIVVASGEPIVELQVSADDLRAFLGDVKTIDLESAKSGKSGIIEPRTLKGFRDYLPEDMLPRQAMINTIVEVFERFGFVPLQTPALEYSDILLGKMGTDAEKLLFRFNDNGGRDVCLRYDLTVPLARVAAQYQDLPKPFKRYQIAPVWRAENPGRGRFREFFQCDCDIVGSPSLLYDAECIALDLAVMKALGVRAEVRFNNRKVLAALGASLSVSDDRQTMAIFRTIDKIPSQGQARVRELLKTEANCNDAQVDRIMRFVEISGSNEEMLASLESLLGASAASAVGELRTVLNYVGEMTGSTAGVKLDFSIARGLDYYTGTVYETFLLDLPGFGSVMSGGRYDGLIAVYSGKQTPAVGISVGLDRLFSGLIELGKIKKTVSTSRVAIVPMDAACVSAALKVLGKVREAGVAAELCLESEQKPKLDKQLSLAGKKGIPYAAILGSNEVAKGTVMLKDLNARTQEELSVEQAIAKLKS
ncbi:MAG TPA: histidine--tRNA ligase [Planctomycetota bacterium]|nr:histidine--tRNA ligase [Planctomycetota bacterium]